MLERLERGLCFYCAAGHIVPGWAPGLPKPPRQYRMCVGSRKGWDGAAIPCRCPCEIGVEFPPMVGFSSKGNPYPQAR